MPRTARILMQNATTPISRASSETHGIVKGKKEKKGRRKEKKTARTTLARLRFDISS